MSFVGWRPQSDLEGRIHPDHAEIPVLLLHTFLPECTTARHNPEGGIMVSLRRMVTVHLIHGFLGAGKTTFARRLEADLPALRFTHDEWVARLYGEDPPADFFPEYHRRVSEQIASLWPRCAELGIDVVLDVNFWSRRERDETRARAAAVGADARLYRLACSDDEAWRRIEKRNRDLNGALFIARETFERLKQRFEPLDVDEACIEVAGEPG